MGCLCSKVEESETALESKPVESVAIIGGGIAGMTAAYFLAKKGISVCVYEKNKSVGNETSYGPAAVTMWKSVSKAFDFDGTIDISAAGLSDALRYVEGSAWTILTKDPNRGDMMSNARKEYDKFMEDHPEGNAIMNQNGLIYMLDKNYFEKNKKTFANDASMEFYTKAEFEQQKEIYEPLFDGADYYGVILSKEEGYVDPQRTVALLAKKIQEMGGVVKTGITVDRITEHDKGVWLVVKGSYEPTYDACVVALGAFPGEFVKASGFDDGVSEIFGIKGYSVTGRMPVGTLRRGVVDGCDTKFIRPYVDKNGTYCVRFGGIADPYDDDDPYKINWDRMEEFAKNDLVKKMFEHNQFDKDKKIPFTPDYDHDCVVEEGKVEIWTGIRPVNKQGRVPLIRYIHGSERSMVLSGFGSNGFVMCWHAGPEVAKRFTKKETKKKEMFQAVV